MKFSPIFALNLLVLTGNDVSPCFAAIGDSRLQVAISNKGPITSVIDKIIIKPGATARLYDPATNVTYHETNNSQILEALGTMRHPLHHTDKCRSMFSKVPTRICDPESVIPFSQARELKHIIHTIPRDTGCQCDAFQQCNHYETGYFLYIAVVPVVMDPVRYAMTQKNLTYTFQMPRNMAGESTTASLVGLFGQLESNFPSDDLHPVDLVINREMSGKLISLFANDTDVHETLAHYLRSMWKTGECDEDMIICFFPKEKRVSVSIGNRIFEKLTKKCIRELVADVNRAMANYGTASSEQKQAVINVLDHFDDNDEEITPEVRRQQKERLRLTTLFKMFVDDLNKLIQSRSDGSPCEKSVSTTWSDYEIAGFAIVTGIGISIILSAILRLCRLCSDFVDRLIGAAPLFQKYPEIAAPPTQLSALGRLIQLGQKNKNSLSTEKINDLKRPENTHPYDKDKIIDDTATKLQYKLRVEAPPHQHDNRPSVLLVQQVKHSKKPTAV